MITAISTQILDANNYNLSPATNIESVYFEQISSTGEVARMSLRNRTIVAGDTINLNGFVTSSFDSVRDITIPYVYFSNVNGTSESTGRIIQANAAQVNIGEAIHKALMNDMSDRITYTAASDMYLSRTNANWVNDTVRIGKDPATDGILLSRTGGQQVISMKNDRLSMTVSGEKSSVYANNDLTVTGVKSLALRYGTTSGDGISMSNDTVRIMDNAVDIGYAADVASGIAGSDVTIRGRRVSAVADSLEISNTSGTSFVIDTSVIKLNSSHVVMYDRELENPYRVTTDGRRNQLLFLSLSRSSSDSQFGYYWKTTPTLTITSVDDGDKVEMKSLLGGDNATVYQGHIYTADPTGSGITRYNILGKELNTTSSVCATDMYVKYLQSGNEKRVLMKKHDRINEAVDFITINDRSIIGNGNIELISPNTVSRMLNVRYTKESLDSQQQYKIFGGNYAQIKTLNERRAGMPDPDRPDAAVQYSDAVYYKGNGALYAASYYSNSDERLKEDIRPVSDIDAPLDVVSFTWKDSGKKSYGFIAQNVEITHPELVDTDDNGLMKVDYQAALSLALGKQQNEIRELKAEIAELRGMLTGQINNV